MVILEEKNSVDQGQGVARKITLDQFWRLSQAKNEKSRVDAASKILQAVNKSEVEVVYVVTRLVKGLAGSNNQSRHGHFICLTELMRQASIEYKTVVKQVHANLKVGGTLTKGEEADYLVAQLLAYSAMLRAEVVKDDNKEEVVKELLEVSGSRNYLLLPVIKLLVEHFLGKSDESIINTIINTISVKTADLNIDSLYLLLSIYKLDEDLVTEQFLEEVGVKKLFGKKALETFSTCLLSANLPPAVVGDHPCLQLLVSLLVEKQMMTKFWKVLGPEMTATNSKGVIGWMVLKEVGQLAGAVNLLQDMLTTHTLNVGVQLANKQGSVKLVKDVLNMVVAGVEMGKLDRSEMVKKFMDIDLCWDKLPVGGTVSQLLSKAEADTVKEVGKVYVENMLGDGKIVERVHSANMIIKIVGLPAVQEDLAYRGQLLQNLASVGVLSGVVGVGALNSNGREQMKDVLFRGLDSRNKSLESSVVLLVSIVKYVREQLSKKVMRMKPLNAGQEAVSKASEKVLDKLEKKWNKNKEKEAGVFLFLYCQMWLQVFSQPELATEVLEELAPVYERWSKGDKKKVGEEEPAWIEVVTEILISLLAQNNHLLRGVVGAVFSVVGKDVTAPAMGSLLAVINQKEGDTDKDEDEDEDNSDDEDGEEENGNEKESSEDDDSDSDDDDEEEEDKEIDPDLTTKLSGALGDHAADSESDIDMDEVPDEEMAKLDEKLAGAFKALGGRKDGLGKKKAALSSLANMHFKLRVLELVELYLNHSPKPALTATIVPVLIESLDKAIRSESSLEPLVKRLLAVLSKAAKIKVDGDISSETGDQVVKSLTGLMELGSSGSAVVNTLGKTFPRLTTFLLRMGEQGNKMNEMQELYSSSLSAWLHQASCVLPNDVFGLAMAHSWPGCWALASTLATSSFSPEVRQYRKVASLTFLSSLLQNKFIVGNSTDEVQKIVKELAPALSQELLKLKDVMGKAKPKYVYELFNILNSIKGTPSDEVIDWKLVVENLQNICKVWPANKTKIFAQAKTALLKLGGKCGVKLEITQIKPIAVVNGENSTDQKPSKKKKKHKKKSQENLKKAKEMKLEMVANQDDSVIPSFAAMLDDNINDETTESKKRKSDAEDIDQPVKVKKAKKKDVEEETPMKIKKSKKKKSLE